MGHQRPWVRKAGEITDPGHEGDCGNEAEAPQTHQPLDQGVLRQLWGPG
jgi:hypothetical protein